MKIYLASFEFGGYKKPFVECFASKQARADAIEEVSGCLDFYSSAYLHMEVALHDVDVKPTKKDVARFFNAYAQRDEVV